MQVNIPYLIYTCPLVRHLCYFQLIHCYMLYRPVIEVEFLRISSQLMSHRIWVSYTITATHLEDFLGLAISVSFLSLLWKNVLVGALLACKSKEKC